MGDVLRSRKTSFRFVFRPLICTFAKNWNEDARNKQQESKADDTHRTQFYVVLVRG
jgi:hypothetical protein